MLSLLLAAQIIAATPTPSAMPIYSSEALKALIAEASVANRIPPTALREYRSRVETETSLLIRDTLGREHTAEVEQLATRAEWTRDGNYDLHIIGYRTQSVGVPY